MENTEQRTKRVDIDGHCFELCAAKGGRVRVYDRENGEQMGQWATAQDMAVGLIGRGREKTIRAGGIMTILLNAVDDSLLSMSDLTQAELKELLLDVSRAAFELEKHSVLAGHLVEEGIPRELSNS